MQPYASHTNGDRNLAELRKYGWHLLRTPFTTGSSNHGFRYAIDNGAWRAYQQGLDFDAVAFQECLSEHASDAEFIVVPDIVCGGLASLEFSREWMSRLKRFGRRLLVPVQDGMKVGDLSDMVSNSVGIFVGGSTEFKEGTASMWGRLCRSKGAYLHVGRVNTCRRIAICAEASADSFDGTSATVFSKNVRKLTMASRQREIFAV